MSSIADGKRAALGLAPPRRLYFIYRHAWPVRLAHWVGAVCLVFLLLSGFTIFNSHPALYIGETSDFDHPVFATNVVRDSRNYAVEGLTWIFGHPYDTTGWLGLSRVDGIWRTRGLPSWITLPGYLAMSRKFHFAFAWLLVINGALFFLYGFLGRHFRRDLIPTARDMHDLPRDMADHARLKFPRGEAARHYNPLQKLAYSLVLFVLAPLIVLTGIAMSPTMDAAWPLLPWLLGGRQTARTIHFLCAISFLLFIIVHIAMAVLSGPWNNLRSMLTGWYGIRKETGHD